MTKESLLQKIVLNDDILQKFNSKIFAQNFYAALCNTVWEDSEHSELEFSVSWRSAARFVSNIRWSYFNQDEDYLDYYCSGIKSQNNNDPLLIEEGLVTPEISECMETLGLRMIVGPEIYDEEFFKDISLC